MNGYIQHIVASDRIAQIQPGATPLVIFQHGLCSDANQPAEVFPPNQGFRHGVLDCRGHGHSPIGDPANLSIATFTNDLATLIAQTGKPLAVGGISMGAAIALRLAVIRPNLVNALILSRPAWVTQAAPANMRPNAEVGRLIAQGETVAVFNTSQTAQTLARTAPDNLASLRSFFTRQPLHSTAALLARIAADGPGVTEAQLKALNIPTLILGTAEDDIHPLTHAQRLATLIPDAQLVIAPTKGRDRIAHIAFMQSAILHFLKGLA